MALTPYHAQYYAYTLTQSKTGDTVDRLGSSLVNAKIDLNPHQVDAALFAFKSPLSKGALLADEVGLGKTIEAGIVLTQFWAEGRNKILIIAPSNLRKQWSEELLDKFFLPTQIMDKKQLNKDKKEGLDNPFDQNQIVICSYHFAKNHEQYLARVQWDLVVMDEAQKVRNTFKSGNVIGKTLKRALDKRRKLLLTATPLQNSLLEIYGLVSFIDEYIFGDFDSFKQQFINNQQDDDNYQDLKARLQTVVHRNLRNNVQEYVQYTNRKALTFEFTPYPKEQELYDKVSEYLHRETLYALPNNQRQLITLVLRKLLASSSYAISNTLQRLVDRLEALMQAQGKTVSKEAAIPAGELVGDFEAFDESSEEAISGDGQESVEQLSGDELEQELNDLRHFLQLAREIDQNAKGERLKQALPDAFDEIKRLGGSEKAVIFTESRRTQDYLKNLLEQEPEYQGQIVCFNGQNKSEEAQQIYKRWLERHRGSDRVTGSKEADTRAALVDYFREEAKIMIATEAAAEGVNLQFCSLVINYDLPWNPQRVEQRIGRCHRYGQPIDVVVVNFINRENAADNRVYELLRDKFELFDGVFGASDVILGNLESGVDFEKRIANIYQECRTQEEINEAFNQLQNELEGTINDELKSTRDKLLSHFDQSVVKRLKITEKTSQEYLNEKEKKLWWFSLYMLGDRAAFDQETQGFLLDNCDLTNEAEIPAGFYTFRKNADEGHIYRLGHPLAQQLVKEAKANNLASAEVTFQYSDSEQNHEPLNTLVGRQGELALYLHRIQSLETEENLIFIGTTDSGESLTQDQMERLFELPAVTQKEKVTLHRDFTQQAEEQASTILENYQQHKAQILNEEYDKLERWAKDRQNALRQQLNDLNKELQDLRRQKRISNDEMKKLELNRSITEKKREIEKADEQYRSESRKIDEQKEEMMDEIEQKLRSQEKLIPLFQIRWQIQ